MNNLSTQLKNLRNDESGQDMIEYALVAALISLASVAALTTLSAQIGVIFTNLTTKLTAAAT